MIILAMIVTILIGALMGFAFVPHKETNVWIVGYACGWVVALIAQAIIALG